MIHSFVSFPGFTDYYQGFFSEIDELSIVNKEFAIHPILYANHHDLQIVGKGRFSALKCYIVCQYRLRNKTTGAIFGFVYNFEFISQKRCHQKLTS